MCNNISYQNLRSRFSRIHAVKPALAPSGADKITSDKRSGRESIREAVPIILTIGSTEIPVKKLAAGL